MAGSALGILINRLPKVAQAVFRAWGSWEVPPEPILGLYRRGLVDGEAFYEDFVKQMHNVSSGGDGLVLSYAEPFIFARLVGCAFFQLALAGEGGLATAFNIDNANFDGDFVEQFLRAFVARPYNSIMGDETAGLPLAKWARIYYRYVNDEQFEIGLKVLDQCISRTNEPEMQFLLGANPNPRELLYESIETLIKIRKACELRAYPYQGA